MPGPDVVLARPRMRSVYRDAARMFRDHFGIVVGTAAVVLGPFAVVDGLGLLEFHFTGNQGPLAFVSLGLAIIAGGISVLAWIFYSGLLDHVSAAWHRGEAAPAPRSLLAKLPWGQLALASVLVFGAIVLGTLLAVLPGFAALTLFILTGPVLVREELSAVAAMRRSARLVSRRPVLVVLTAVVPTLIELYLADLADEIFGHSQVTELTAEIVATLFLASFVGLLEVVTAHQLIATEAEPV